MIIGKTGRGGIVSTCSYEARKYGAKSGMPTYQALAKCPNAIMISGDYRYYQEKSNEFFNFVKSYTKLVEEASIDECYVDFTNVLSKVSNPVVFLRNFQKNLYKSTGLKCSIGVAPTKFLAKMDSDMKKPFGLVIIHRKNAKKILSPLPIEDFYGIGKKTSPKLMEIGIKTIGDLINKIESEDLEVKKILGKFYFIINDCVNGYSSDEINTKPFDPKSIGHSTTLLSDAVSIEELEKPLLELCNEVSKDAKEQNKVGKNVQIVLKDNEFKSINRSKKLENKTNNKDEIYKFALQLLKENYDGRPIRLIGVTLENLVKPHEEFEQLSIFDNYDEIHEKRDIQQLIDELNKKMHKNVFKTAADHLKEKENETK